MSASLGIGSKSVRERQRLRDRRFQCLRIEWLGDHEGGLQGFARQKTFREPGHKNDRGINSPQNFAHCLNAAVAIFELDVGQHQIRPGALG